MARGSKRGGRGGATRGRGRGRTGRGQVGRSSVQHIQPSYQSESDGIDMQPIAYEDSANTRTDALRGSRSRPWNRGRGKRREDMAHFDHTYATRRALSQPQRGRFLSPEQASSSGVNGRAGKRALNKKSRTSPAYEENPYLRPITFVRSQLTPLLFTSEEEIFRPVMEESNDSQESHVPTADAVLHVFNSDLNDSLYEDADEADLEEVDFADLHTVVAEIEKLAAGGGRTASQADYAEEMHTHSYDDDRHSVQAVDRGSESTQSAHATTSALSSLPELDDEVIVYVAPHPRTNTAISAKAKDSCDPAHATSSPEVPAVTNESEHPPDMYHIDPGQSSPTDLSERLLSEPSVLQLQPTNRLAVPSRPQHLRHLRGVLKGRPVRAKRRLQRHPLFGSFGAMLDEARLHSEGDTPRDTRRLGDSDIDWGSVASDESSDADDGGMEADADINVACMEQFIYGMGVAGSTQQSAGDLEDEVRMALEDARDEDRNLTVEGESAGYTSDASTSSGDSGSSTTSDFYARLQFLRGAKAGDDSTTATGSGEPLASLLPGEDIAARMEEDLFRQSEAQGKRGNRTQQTSPQASEPDSFSVSATRARDKGKYLPRELQDQWARDRAKKAERKREREAQRLLAAMDPLARKKGGKKSRQAARLAVSRGGADAKFNIAKLEQQIQNFLADLGGPKTMALPPMSKESRAVTHELASAFNLKSESRGKGHSRYTSLIKTTRSGININEGKVAAIVRRNAGTVNVIGKSVKTYSIKPREGDIVGKEAPRIGSSNVGFRMLSAMGWESGDRLGGDTGGLEVPLAAVVKTSKLGLGAGTKSLRAGS